MVDQGAVDTIENPDTIVETQNEGLATGHRPGKQKTIKTDNPIDRSRKETGDESQTPRKQSLDPNTYPYWPEWRWPVR